MQSKSSLSQTKLFITASPTHAPQKDNPYLCNKRFIGSDGVAYRCMVVNYAHIEHRHRAYDMFGQLVYQGKQHRI